MGGSRRLYSARSSWKKLVSTAERKVRLGFPGMAGGGGGLVRRDSGQSPRIRDRIDEKPKGDGPETPLRLRHVPGLGGIGCSHKEIQPFSNPKSMWHSVPEHVAILP